VFGNCNNNNTVTATKTMTMTMTMTMVDVVTSPLSDIALNSALHNGFYTMVTRYRAAHGAPCSRWNRVLRDARCSLSRVACTALYRTGSHSDDAAHSVFRRLHPIAGGHCLSW
jgi:hypothetical protein